MPYISAPSLSSSETARIGRQASRLSPRSVLLPAAKVATGDPHRRAHIPKCEYRSAQFVKIFITQVLPLGRAGFLYSVLNATTGSFFAALLDGMIPAISVSTMLIAIRISAAGIGRNALKVLIPVRWCKMRLIGMHSR